MATVYDYSAKTITGEEQALSAYKGKVLLIVNVASECGFTPQYQGLEALQKKFSGDGFSVLGFPSNQFGNQDPGTNEEIGAFCVQNYGVSFPMMEKIEVNGPGATPLYKWLAKEAPGLLGSTAIKWNFTKFLVGKDGRVIKRYAPLDTPASMTRDIEAALAS